MFWGQSLCPAVPCGELQVKTKIKGGSKEQPLPFQRRETEPELLPKQSIVVEADTAPQLSAFWGPACHLDTVSTWEVPENQAKFSSSKMEASNDHNTITVVGWGHTQTLMEGVQVWQNI